MRVTSIGHAGFFIETRHGTILTDPWFNPAYFASWFPFPSNEHIDPAAIGSPDYLYISHMHHDHMDPEFLRRHVSKDAVVLLPDYPLDLLERELRAMGFRHFVRTRNYEPVELDGLRIMIAAAVAPTDGPLGDSALMVDDGEVRILDQNDSRPLDLERLASFGPYDLHMLQFSGAIWYPMVYKLPQKMKEALGRKKRINGMDRALRYIELLGARWVVPSAGPPCFLDDDLFGLNDFDRDPANTFPDAAVFLDYMAEHGHGNGLLVIPGSTVEISPASCTLTHPFPEDEVRAIFEDKRLYLEAYKARQQPRIDAIKSSWRRGEVDLVAALREWFEPLLEQADMTCVGVNGRVLLDCGDEGIVLDFQHRKVYRWQGEEWEYRMAFDRALLEECVRQHYEDWVNELFLSCRFEAERKGPYNEYVYNFFKCLSQERLQYAEGWYAEQTQDQQLWECEGYLVQRRCPHLKADLTRFGEVHDGILTCRLHGWQFDLATGRCLTSPDRHLFTQPVEREEVAQGGVQRPAEHKAS
ncbi:Rieske (2Fe-2S) domain protein [Thermobaculum terrenum ATCC BAA-798]|uniref:Rieske (2Fe-2S) domain protein n=1 Tax=Thermobaculum terrenum (strain ATCC BAA-798 / CCMEE 7001 / YNP1) TaxID=525904 RepID=D1CJ05_THET1|nr:Rieske 2Fe-2S domain-containing protein [Thermobaculum terrenum]ACZ43725.1 Rieske (2Fe-2S) domain protein [Thermobaculum terrenum ATCC BAA-798]